MRYALTPTRLSAITYAPKVGKKKEKKKLKIGFDEVKALIRLMKIKKKYLEAIYDCSNS